MSTPFQQSPYLRQQRNFPSDNAQALTIEIDRAYIDIASKVNARSIGLYGLNFPMVTGDQWFLTGQSTKQQVLRQLYTFTAVGNIAHGINFTSVSQITGRSYGSFTDGTNWYGSHLCEQRGYRRTGEFLRYPDKYCRTSRSGRTSYCFRDDHSRVAISLLKNLVLQNQIYFLWLGFLDARVS